MGDQTTTITSWGDRIKRVLGKLYALGVRLPPKQALLWIGLLAISVRLLFTATFSTGLFAIPSEPDGNYYLSLGNTLVEKTTFGLSGKADINTPPGQPFFLAVLLAVSGKSILFLHLGQILLSVLTVFIVYFLGCSIFNPAVGFWSAVLLALDPAQIYLSSTFLSEPLFTCLIACGIWLLVLSRDNFKENALVKFNLLWQPILAGMSFAAAGLTRNQGWPFAFFIFLLAVVTRGKLLNVKIAGVMLLSTCLALIPWAIRNYQVSGEWMFVSANASGKTIWSANNPQFAWRQPMPMSLPIYDAPAGLTDTQLNEYYQNKALTWIKGNPGQFLLNGVKKIIVLFNFDPMLQRQGDTYLSILAGIIPYGLLIPFIFLGMVQSIKNPDTWILLAFILYNILISFVYFGDSRIRATFQPYLYLFAVSWFDQRLKCRLQ
jgi:4-amino-4-deoxy-L-arabinose transferase-like glycosyltransferase